MYKPFQTPKVPSMSQGATPRSMLPPARTTYNGKQYSTPYVPSSYGPNQNPEYKNTVSQNIPLVSYPWHGESQMQWNQQQYGNPYAYSNSVPSPTFDWKMLAFLGALGIGAYFIFTRKSD